MFLDLLASRRSIRKYKPVPVEPEKVDALVETALRSFSSRGFCPWRFIVVDNRETLKSLSELKSHGSSFLKNAPLGIVVIGAPDESDVWVEDTSIASALIHLAAHDMGLGSCWIQIRKREHSSFKSSDTYVKEVLAIPDIYSVESVIAIGYPDQELTGHAKESLEFEKVWYNRYGEKD